MTNIRNACRGEYAYDDNNGLQTCATNPNYTVMCAPRGGGSDTSVNGTHSVTPDYAPGIAARRLSSVKGQ